MGFHRINPRSILFSSPDRDFPNGRIRVVHGIDPLKFCSGLEGYAHPAICLGDGDCFGLGDYIILALLTSSISFRNWIEPGHFLQESRRESDKNHGSMI
jgi:hypothetical protein